MNLSFLVLYKEDFSIKTCFKYGNHQFTIHEWYIGEWNGRMETELRVSICTSRTGNDFDKYSIWIELICSVTGEKLTKIKHIKFNQRK